MRLSVEDHNKRVRDIIKMTQQGFTQVEMAEKLGISASALGRFIIKARSFHELPPKPKARVDTHNALRIGSMTEAIQKQSQEFQSWLVDQTRHGLTVSEVAISTMLDAFYEDTEE